MRHALGEEKEVARIALNSKAYVVELFALTVFPLSSLCSHPFTPILRFCSLLESEFLTLLARAIQIMAWFSSVI